MDQSIAIIPARYDSSRFPGKPLAMIQGQPMIYWVYHQCLKAKFDRVVVATDDQRIMDAVIAFNGEAMMTKGDHLSGTSRCIEVSKAFPDYRVVVNVQGDEPLIDPQDLNHLIAAIQSGASIVSLYEEVSSMEASSQHVVKVVLDHHSSALYFSRSLIPFPRNQKGDLYKKHVGVYAFDRSVLLSVSEMNLGVLSKVESLEQLTWLENGHQIRMIKTDEPHIGIDTPEDLIQLNLKLESGELFFGA